MARQQKGGRPIIRRQEGATGEGHHGGAWKVAYADFVTAMMAFFLLMWLLNATTEDQRKGLADYFSPNNLMSHASSGTGQPFGGHTAFDSGAMVSDRGAVEVVDGHRPVPLDPDDDPDATAEPGKPDTGSKRASARPAGAGKEIAQAGSAKPPADAAAKTVEPTRTERQDAEKLAAEKAKAEQAAEQAKAEQARLQKAADEIRKAVAADPALSALAGQLAVDLTPEGLRIQLLDQEHQVMFPTGSAVPNEAARLLIAKLTPILLRLPGQVSIQGHTDAAPYPGQGRTNWDLSAERANAARRLLADSGLPDQRIRDVTGHADHDLLLPAQPLAPANRRIAITVLRQHPAPEPAGEPTG